MSPWWLVVLLLALTGLGLLSWSVRALDLPGAVGAFILGLLVTLLGGLGWLLLMATFTIVGVGVTRLGKRRKVVVGEPSERGLPNVVANGAAAALAAVALLAFDSAPLAFATALAVVTADTMASEIGALSGRARSIVPPFVRMSPGQNGGVSWLGQLAAVAGAALIAAAAVPLLGLAWTVAWLPALAGFLGCQLDSILGATLEREAPRRGPLSNEHVNLISSVLPMALVLLLA